MTPAPIGLILSPEEAARYSAKFGQQRVTAIQPTSFQARVLLRKEKELGLLGGKWGGKSYCALMFLLKGNPQLPNFDRDGNPLLVNQSYIYHPNYRATILRRNQVDLDDFIRRFAQLAKPFGGIWKNGLFQFPSGAVVAAGHLADREAWQKYIGIASVRYVVEEAALIPEFSLYEQILTNCRSVYPEMVPQIMITSNAGGPGTGWLIERFYDAKDSGGIAIPAWNTITDEAPDPFEDGKTVSTSRVWCFSTLQDNPHAKNDPSYIATMANLKDEKLRKAYIWGDWRIFTGTYFNSFRPKGPDLRQGDPDHANHVIPPVVLQPWWPRLGSIDVGHEHETAVYKACRLPNGQHHIYYELVVNRTSFIQIGYELAKSCIDELNKLPSHSIMFFCSPDAYHTRTGSDQKSIIELLALGIAKVIGGEAIHTPDVLIRKMKSEAENRGQMIDEASNKFFEELRSNRRAGITLRMAEDARVIGWQYCREALRWEQIGSRLPPYDQDLANYLLMEHPEKYDQYQSMYRGYKPEVLPKLQIWNLCPRLIAAIPKARHYAVDAMGKNPEDVDKAHFLGMDSIDSWRYLEMGISDTFPDEPFESFRDRTMDELLRADPSMSVQQKIMIQRQIEAEHKAKGVQGDWFNMPRKASRRNHQIYLEKLSKHISNVEL